MENLERDEIEKYRIASEKFRTNGQLGVTMEDHLAIGSTPPQKLAENPGKTLEELMSDEEISEWLMTQKNLSETLGGNYGKISGTHFTTAVNYLKSIGRSISETFDRDNTVENNK